VLQEAEGKRIEEQNRTPRPEIKGCPAAAECELTRLQVTDGLWSPDDMATFGGADTAAWPANHTTSGPGRARNAPPYSYASAISSARAGSRLPGNTNNSSSSAPLTYYQSYEQPATDFEDGWATPASGSGSMSNSEPLSRFPSNSNVIPSPQLLLQQYQQVESQTLMPQLRNQAYAQQSRSDRFANPVWTGDTSDPEGVAGFSFSPSMSAASGSFVDEFAVSPEVSESELGFSAGSGLANYASASTPASPVSSRDHSSIGYSSRDQPSQHQSSGDHHDKKRVKIRTSHSRAAATADPVEAASTSSSSSVRGGKGKQPKRELRSASRTSKNAQQRVSETPDQQRSRSSHNLVEKQYRNRLNAQFEDLLRALPESAVPAGSSLDGDGPANDGRLKMGDRKRVSKAEVLDMARQRILFLEEENRKIERENEELRRTSQWDDQR